MHLFKTVILGLFSVVTVAGASNVTAQIRPSTPIGPNQCVAGSGCDTNILMGRSGKDSLNPGGGQDTLHGDSKAYQPKAITPAQGPKQPVPNNRK